MNKQAYTIINTAAVSEYVFILSQLIRFYFNSFKIDFTVFLSGVDKLSSMSCLVLSTDLAMVTE